ncbi:MAG: DUF389 domain-containing protein [Acidobacteriota bacterium]|nr:DUF389 domain-containing protein [Acidobacteriota bacterium]
MTSEDRPPSLRQWIIERLGLDLQRREEIYASLSASANLRDGAYWLEIIFSAGIASLGLILNSPAVIIGAMLISPLMGPILSNGLALAAGDLVLGIRAASMVMISAAVAVAFSTLLVILLPFREMTTEIAARTQPNTLDLVIALFSGAVGSIAVCKNVRGVATSIPGVAIAVALMPPLCVVGYGIGVAVTLDPEQGRSVIRGGGLLFLTNLVAITFTAMLVFLLFHIASHQVRAEWKIPLPKSLRTVGSLPGRIVLVCAFVLLLFFPLSRSLDALKQEIAHRHFENLLQQRATHLWQNGFAKFPNGTERSYIESLSASQSGSRLQVQLRIFTSSPYSAEERAAFVQQLTLLLKRPPKSIDLALVEIPTSRYEVASRTKPEPAPPPPPTVSEMLVTLSGQVDGALGTLVLPPPARLVDHALINRPSGATIELSYLSDHEITTDARALLENEMRRVLGDAAMTVSFRYIPSTYIITFPRHGSTLGQTQKQTLAAVHDLLIHHPSWKAAVTIRSGERSKAERLRKVAKALTGSDIDQQRVVFAESDAPPTGAVAVAMTAATK